MASESVSPLQYVVVVVGVVVVIVVVVVVHAVAITWPSLLTIVCRVLSFCRSTWLW